MKKLMKDIFLKLIFSISKNWFTTFTWKNQDWKIKKIVANLHDNTEYVIDIRNLKQALNHGLVFTEVDKVIKFN